MAEFIMKDMLKKANIPAVVSSSATSTEEIWNGYWNTKNYIATIYILTDYDFLEHTVKSTDKAVEIDGKIVVSDSDKKYVLEETDGIFYAKEYNGIDLPERLLPEGLSFSDFEFDKQSKAYVQKNADGTEIYSIAFVDGVLSFVQIERAPDPENPDYIEIIAFEISEIGSAVINVPDYIME